MKRIKLLPFLLIIFLGITAVVQAAKDDQPEFSKAGFWEVKDSGREVFDFNIGWRFIKGAAKDAPLSDFDDSNWQVVNCPHGLELISEEDSGSNNYQGEAWYRKHFVVPDNIAEKQLRLHFEGVMGKCKVWLNGELLGENYGGYLPFSVNLSAKVKAGAENVLAVWVDNSNDPDYPPGKPQENLDFSYFGGIYRDVWLTATNSVYVSNAIDASKVAGGGIFTHIEKLSEKQATVVAKVDLQNDGRRSQKLSVLMTLKDKQGNKVAEYKQLASIKGNQGKQVSATLLVSDPELWTPWSPELYRLEVQLSNSKGQKLDGVASYVGIRKIEFRGKDGFYLNNKPYPGKLIGANRHQDHAVVGNALSNNAQWRDAKLLKDAGCDIVRAAHYPVDPAFMEACDQLGLFYIVATPGWQFWNDKPIFKQRVFRDVRNMVRRDRNYACVIMWEPILNETWYPDDFAKQVHNLVHEEYPFQGVYTVCDSHAKGQEHFDVIYSHPFRSEFYRNVKDNTKVNRQKLGFDYSGEKRCVFTREWGDCVDDWNSHNSPSRVVRGWGERAQLVQAKHYANPDYVYTSWEALYNTPAQHIGGALWHSFDHQRGYHPDTFYGGITDVFRQPKYSYHLFASQRDVSESNAPMIFVAHEMSPISEPDVTVFTNCDEVRLIIYEKDTLLQKVADLDLAMPHPMVVFKDVFNFIDVKNLHRAKKQKQASFIAEGLIDGKVVARYKRMPSKRPSKIQLTIDDNGLPLKANGTDFVRVIASVVDQDGIVKRLNKSDIRFEIEGEGELISNSEILSNPKKLEWGTAPILVRSSLKSGKITIKASLIDQGINSPVGGEITFESFPSDNDFIYQEEGREAISQSTSTDNELKNDELQKRILQLEKELNDIKLKEIERGQEEFEGGRK
ncbi:MAG: beta galactosidase jelly roll domain-containing protein [Carboxylicivirga sp.]|nr:beta galactosidase jelly roll domain-containing protein [Carboxylicivirga sp.]